MNPVNQHFTLVVGIDSHFTTTPPFNPLHPFIGMIADPMDYIPFVGASVFVNQVPRGVSDTSGFLFSGQHIPLVGTFAEAPLIAHESVNFFGSLHTFAEGRRLSPCVYSVMSCNDAGIPLSAHAGEKYTPKFSLFAPTSFSIPIPKGNPVLVGGPMVPDLTGAAINLLASYGFSALLKKAGTLFKKPAIQVADDLGSTLEKEADKTIRCGDPVNVVTGVVQYTGCDFELAGPLPLKWERSWYSDSHHTGLLGHGYTTPFDTKLKCCSDYNAVLLPDGRGVGFPLLQPGEQYYLRTEKLTLKRAPDHYQLVQHKTRLRYILKPHPTKAGEHRLSAIFNEQGFSINIAYQHDQLAYIRDSAGRMVHVTTDHKHRVTAVQVAEKSGKVHPLVQYTYNEAGDLCEIKDALHQATRLVYEAHRLVKKTDRNGQSFYWQYENSRCTRSWGDHGLLEVKLDFRPGHNIITDGLGRSTTYHYDERYLITQITAAGAHRFIDYTAFEERFRDIDEAGHVTGYSYDERGNCTSIQRPDGALERFIYDEDDRVTLHTDAAGHHTLRVYNTQGLLQTLIRADNGMTTYEYNADHLLAAICEEDGRRTTFKYDTAYNLTTRCRPDGSTDTWHYDGLGRCIRAINAAGGVQSFLYDPLGRVTRIQQPDGNIVRLGYDAYDGVTTARDSQHDVRFSYTPLGSLHQRKEGHHTLQFLYNGQEELLKIVNEHQEEHRFQRDDRGRIISETGFDGTTRQYERLENGWIKQVTHPGGRHTLYEYDAAGRVARCEYGDGTWELFNYNKNGQLIEATNEQASIYLERDNMGRVVLERSVIAGQAYTVRSVYNRQHQRTAIHSSLGAAMHLHYTPTGQVARLQAGIEDIHWQADFQYNALGLETERWLPGGIISSFEYDHASHPLRHKIHAGNKDLRKRKYTWNANERLVSILDELSSGQVNYTHDDFGNLAMAEFEDGCKQYKSPDAVGNLYRTPQQNDRHYHPGGQLACANGWAHTYDTEGNLQSRTADTGATWQYTWYGNGMLRAVTRPDGEVISFEYDALGRRISKIAGGQVARWMWDGHVPLHEWRYALDARPACTLDEMGQLQVTGPEPVEGLVTWVFEEGRFAPAAKLGASGSYAVVTDYLGTPVEMYDEQGRKTWACELDIYGKARTLEMGEVGDCPFRYQGQYEDVETGLYYNRFRYYDPESGGYLSKDPIGLKGGNNQYTYISDVLRSVDPFGLSGVSIYRGMVEEAGKPKINASARALGARPKVDIPVGADDMIHPNTGGVSVSPSPQDLPAHRRPPELGGTGKDPIWSINTDDLGPNLQYVPDKPGHGTIQPTTSMSFEEYQKELAKTNSKWNKVPCH